MLLAYPTVLSTVANLRPSYPLDTSRSGLEHTNRTRPFTDGRDWEAQQLDEFENSFVYHWHEAGDGPDITSYRQQLILQRERALVELRGLGPNHPGRKALEAQMATIDKELAKLDEAIQRSRAQ
jgi:hypothetical protein